MTATVHRAHISEYRTVELVLALNNGLVAETPKGNDPLPVIGLELIWNLQTGALHWVYVRCGPNKHGRYVDRGFDPDKRELPTWLIPFVQEYGPGGGSDG